MSDLLGLILAGGEGRRMGGPKDGVTVPGGTLLTRAWNAVSPAVSRVFLQGALDAPSGLVPSPDIRRDRGPLAGLETGLLEAGESGQSGVVLLAVDLPRITAPVLLELLARWRALPDAEGRAVVVRTRRGIQPLAGIYGAGLTRTLVRWLDEAGEPSARAWVESLGERVVRVPESELVPVAGHPEPFLNVNRPRHVERALELPPPAPPIVSVTGWKDTGKTTLAVHLAGELRSRGYRVMALKHGHRFRLDTPGTDSYRLRHEAGAERVLLAGPEELALLGGWGGAGEPGVAELAARYLHEAEIVVVEGWKRDPLPAVEVLGTPQGNHEALWRRDAPDRDRFLARVARAETGAAPGDGGPAVLNGNDPSVAHRVADVVEERVIPGLRWARRGAARA